jgi:hypothetical protein
MDSEHGYPLLGISVFRTKLEILVEPFIMPGPHQPLEQLHSNGFVRV